MPARQAAAYDPKYFTAASPGSRSSAREILGLLSRAFPFRSVLDVGCGNGAWLDAAEECGATRLVGIDGEWLRPEMLSNPRIEFSQANLEAGFALREKVDLCISVEVAEHLPASAAKTFVASLCAASDVIVFGAAIRLQGGVMHVNEQWQSYWAALFNNRDFQCYDVFRPALWMNGRVECWYRQNTFLYIRNLHPIETAVRRLSALPTPIDIVHPEIYENNIDAYRRLLETPTLDVCCRVVARWGRRQFRRIALR